MALVQCGRQCVSSPPFVPESGSQLYHAPFDRCAGERDESAGQERFRDVVVGKGCNMMCARKNAGGDRVVPVGVGLGGATRAHQPPAPEPLRSGRGSDAAVQTRLDMGPHGIPRGSSLAGQPHDSGSFDAQLSDRPADRPHTQTRPGSTHRVVLLNESHDPAGAFAAHPAPYCATRSAQGPRPKARRSPPPPHARDLERFSPQPGQPTSWLHDLTSSTRASGVRATPIRWKLSKSTSRSHRSQRPSDMEQQQVGRGTAQGP